MTIEEVGRCGAEAETLEMTGAEAEEDGTETTTDEEAEDLGTLEGWGEAAVE